MIGDQDEVLRDVLYWLTLFNNGNAEPGDASLLLDSFPDSLLPTAEQLRRDKLIKEDPRHEEAMRETKEQYPIEWEYRQACKALYRLHEFEDAIHEAITKLHREREGDLLEGVISKAVLDELEAEALRAHVKHGRNSILNPDMPTMLKLAALMEEVGEAAAELTYDKVNVDSTKFEKELTQVASVALSWVQSLRLPREKNAIN